MKHFFFPVFDKLGMPLVGAFSLFILAMETKHQLRKRRIPRWLRMKRNAGLAITGIPVLRFVQIPVFVYLSRWAKKNQVGLLNLVSWPAWITYPLAFLILDYGSYTWHRMNHRFPFLWRFHNVHHVDLDLDITTAFRFHAGEIFMGIFYRGAFVVLAGPPTLLLLVYEIIFEAANSFHHSNWKLPYLLEKWLSYLIVTPRMHGVHHSIVQRETNSNYAVIFSFWDRLHHTVRLNIPQHEINIGVPSYRNPEEQTVGKLLMLPFQKQRPWQLPDGTVPERKTFSPKGVLKK